MLVAFCWSSRKQQTKALSSTEAEYMGISVGSQECIYLLSLVKCLGLDLDGPVLLQEDNPGAIKVAQNPITYSRSKHIDIRYHIVREIVEWEVIQLRYVPTDQNKAVILLKPLAGTSSIRSNETSLVNQYSIFEEGC